MSNLIALYYRDVSLQNFIITHNFILTPTSKIFAKGIIIIIQYSKAFLIDFQFFDFKLKFYVDLLLY